MSPLSPEQGRARFGQRRSATIARDISADESRWSDYLRRMLEFRRFSWPDLELYTDIFNRVCGHESAPSAHSVDSMRRQLEQPWCDPERNILLAWCDGSPAGFVSIFPELKIGRTVASGGVLERFRGLGLGSGLVAAALDRASDLDATVLHVQAADDDEPFHRLLASSGFERVTTYWSMMWRAGAPRGADLPPGYSFRDFKLGVDEERLTELQNAVFGGTWGFCPNTVKEITARVRLERTDPEGIIFVLDDELPVAYCWTSRAKNEFGSIGYISMAGARPEYRGKGIGTAAVAAGMDYLESRAVDRIELEVSAENVAARDLYVNLGFARTKETFWYEKRLS